MPNKYIYCSLSEGHDASNCSVFLPAHTWMVPVWHSRVLIQVISLWPHCRRTTFPVQLFHPELAHKITREKSLVEGFSVLLYSLQLALVQLKLQDDVILISTSPGWDAALQTRSPEFFQKKNSLNHSTTTVIPKIVFQNWKKSDKDVVKDTNGIEGQKKLFFVEQGICKRCWVSTKNGKEGGVLPKSGIMFSLLLFAGSVKLKKKKRINWNKVSKTSCLIMLENLLLGAGGG